MVLVHGKKVQLESLYIHAHWEVRKRRRRRGFDSAIESKVFTFSKQIINFPYLGTKKCNFSIRRKCTDIGGLLFDLLNEKEEQIVCKNFVI